MKAVLRALFLLHLRRPRWLWGGLIVVSLALGWGALRIERRLDLMSLLPTDHPIVKASLETGVGQQEMLWLCAEGGPDDLEARRAWAEDLVERLLDLSHAPLDGLSGEGRLSAPVPALGPGGPALWPPLLAAGSLLEGDGAVGRLLTEHLYGLAPILLGERLAALNDPAEVERRLATSARDLASPDPVRARLAAWDPLRLRELLPSEAPFLERLRAVGHAFPLKLRLGYLETVDGTFVIVPLVLDFPSGRTAETARSLAWLGRGAQGPWPVRASLKDVQTALAPLEGRPFRLQPTGAHAIAYWESQRLGVEVLWSLGLAFLLIGVVYAVGFRTLAGYGFVVLPLLLGMVWALGGVGWLLGRLNVMAAAFGAVLLGIGDDVGILLFSRYREARQSGRDKAWALREALLGTGPGVVAAALATALAFLACAVAPFPGLRDLGLTAGVGLLACLGANLLVLPALLMLWDRGRGAFAPRRTVELPVARPRTWKAVVAMVGFVVLGLGVVRLRWEEDLRRFRQAGNPALALQERLGKVLGAGLHPLALQLPVGDTEVFAQRWNRVASALRAEGLPMPSWERLDSENRRRLGSERWLQRTLAQAERVGLDPVELERPLSALRASAADPLVGLRKLQSLLSDRTDGSRIDLPLRLSEAAQDRIAPVVAAEGGRLVGTRPLFQALRVVAKDALMRVLVLALAAVIAVVIVFGRRLRFVGLALIPVLASQLGALGTLGWTGEPLTFLSLVALPIALGVSIDTALNLLHRARREPGVASRVARVNAVCAGTTLAGFGGLVFSSYRGLRGLGLACVGGTALALLASQWLLPWLEARWPLRRSHETP